ncbi:hypothetical protein JCM24511_07543 [Saitozyma sp. JCM 24511]|nr:hypothetical protein JCM24511_07543 [Saitozyma sp. JCM 24511]
MSADETQQAAGQSNGAIVFDAGVSENIEVEVGEFESEEHRKSSHTELQLIPITLHWLISTLSSTDHDHGNNWSTIHVPLTLTATFSSASNSNRHSLPASSSTKVC